MPRSGSLPLTTHSPVEERLLCFQSGKGDYAYFTDDIAEAGGSVIPLKVWSECLAGSLVLWFWQHLLQEASPHDHQL